ncbi:hypothetical protein BASA81_007439 [Batrachochytrium salamandrivorans]|nr:hypothetical protein BASA81_007439 [Batrachochytrium salamandrivorans]
MDSSLAATLDRTAMLMSEDDDEKVETLAKLGTTLDPSNLQTNKTRSRTVLDNKAVMGVLFNLSATTSSADVAEAALGVLLLLAYDGDNEQRLFQEYPSLLPVAMRKLEFGTENATENVQINALNLLCNLTNNDDNAREMAKNLTLIPLLVAKAESNSEQVQERALNVLWSLAANVDNAREMFTKNPTLIPLLVAKTESNSEQVQEVALEVLQNLANNDDNAREMFTKYPTLVPLLVAKTESDLEQVKIKALNVLGNLAFNVDNKREMSTKNTKLVPLLVAKVESNSEQVQEGALSVLQGLAFNVDNAAEMMETHSAVLLPLLVAKMNGSTRSQAAIVLYNLSCSPANRTILRGNDSVVAALTKGRENKDLDTSFFSLLTLINLFGAEEDSKVLKTDLAMLREIFGLIAHAMNKDGWKLNNPLLAFRYLCVVEHNRQLLWSKYGSEFLTSVLDALQQVIDDKDLDAAENAMSTLAQFSNDTESLVWMRSNKPRLDKVINPVGAVPRCAQDCAVSPPCGGPSQGGCCSNPSHWLKAHDHDQLQLEAPSPGAPHPLAVGVPWLSGVARRAKHEGGHHDRDGRCREQEHGGLGVGVALYRESANCKLECQFAHNNNRKLIPVLVEPGYVFKADGWLGLLLGSKLYYDVSGLYNQAQMTPVILNLLRNEVEGGQVAATVAPPVAVAPKQPVPQNEAEIRQWLAAFENGSLIADKLINEELVGAKDLEMLSNLRADRVENAA